MSEYLTPANVAIVVSLIMSLYAILKAVAPKTKTTIDDSIVALVEKGRPWVRDYAYPIWALVEQLQKAGKLDKLNKYGEFMSILRDGFKDAFGKELPEALEVDAKLMAQGLSAADKLSKAVTVNPQSSLDAAK
ncbi:MAG: hypothetical protein CVV41_06765 [Candidatus Riflebacteria bacterium HGW-Riflebacteria-1]|jgi:hypothetical protein|nr:MAG: hypothetical protein CVV41_06765 [Candidatus Riflebacteria bacterium HGW-Riflebacteria-1]